MGLVRCSLALATGPRRADAGSIFGRGSTAPTKARTHKTGNDERRMRDYAGKKVYDEIITRG